MPQASASSAQRQTWVDVLRGASVLLVILLHAHEFAFNSYLAPGQTIRGSLLTDLVDMINTSVAPFRMELMFLLSGFFVAHGLSKGHSPYLVGKLRNVLYPFLLWSLVIFAMRQGGSVLAKGEPVEWQRLSRVLSGDTALTWFLYDLFLFYLVTPYLRRFNVLAVVLSALALAFVVPAKLYHHSALFYFYIYFYLGDYITRTRVDLAATPSRPILGLSAAALCAVVLMANLASFPKAWPGYLPLVLACLPLIVQLSVWASKGPASAWISYVGRHSIVFYLVHFPIFVGLAFLLRRRLDDGTLIFLTLLAVGVIIPWMVSLIRKSDRLPALNLLFSWPSLASVDRRAVANR